MSARTPTIADENVSTVVRMLFAAKRGTPDELARFLGISRSTVFEKLNGNRRWYAAEVQGLADYFSAPIQTFYAGPGGLLPTNCDYAGTGTFPADFSLLTSQTTLFDLLHTADSAA